MSVKGFLQGKKFSITFWAGARIRERNPNSWNLRSWKIFHFWRRGAIAVVDWLSSLLPVLYLDPRDVEGQGIGISELFSAYGTSEERNFLQLPRMKGVNQLNFND